MRILSGLQPTGRLHLGNYFGMMQQAIALQDEGEALYFIADYHALTTISDPADLRDNVFHLAVDFLACGLDPDRAIFFRQSDVPEVTELAWVLSCACPMGLLERAHSYKDKVARGLEATHGLFSYPVLMAADILLYDSDLVPVGDDQKQHLEITRDLALKINHRYGEGTLTVPEPRIRAESAKVPGLDGEKMSKSYGNTVGLFEEEKALRKKIMRIVTDSTAVEDPKPTGDSTILQLFEVVAGKPAAAEMAASFRAGGLGYGHYKQQLFEAVRDHFAPMAERRQELLSKPATVESILTTGAARARDLARPVLHRLRTAVGLGT